MATKIILLSGTSGVGKTPLIKSFIAQNPYKKIGIPVLYTSREPRPIETEGVDYYFRSEGCVKSLDADWFVIAQTRHIWQAVDIKALINVAAENDVVICDIYYTLVRELLAHKNVPQDIKDRVVRVFIQPVSIDEIQQKQQELGDVSLEDAAAAISKPKLIERALQQGKELTPDVMRDIDIRASHALLEIRIGQDYDFIITNHDGENSPHWKESPPGGEAGQTLETFSQIICASS